MSPLLFLLILCLHLTNTQLFDNDNSNSDPQDNLNIDKSQMNSNQQQPANPNDKVPPINNNIDKDNLEEVLLNEPVNINNNPDIDNNNNDNPNIDIDNQNNDEPIPSPKKKKTTTKSSQSKYAWVSMVTKNMTSIAGARVLSQSLSKHKSTADRILICVPGVSDKALNMLRQFGWKTHTISVNMFDKIKNYPSNIQFELLKILMFNFTAYNSVGYLSPQSMVTTNIDHLFTCGCEALCGTPNDKHHQIYHNNQRHIKKLLSIDNGKYVSDNVEYILYDNNGNMINNNNNYIIGNHESVFDDNIFLMTPEHDLYIDMFTFITSSHDEMEGIQHNYNRMDFPSYLSEYFYHYCKGNGYPISKQNGKYIPPKVLFNCTDIINCKMNKEISKSPCYMLEEGYNFHPSHNDHISSSWHWKQSMKHLTIKIIQYSSYNNNNNNGQYDIKHEYKPWKWRYVLFSGWMIEFNIYANIKPNLYFEFLLIDNNNNKNAIGNDELLESLWQKPILYLFCGIVLMSVCTGISKPIFNLLLMVINKLSKSSPTSVIVIIECYKWIIFPLLLIWSIMIVIKPIKQIFIDEEIIPEAYPFKIAWILALQYCYFTSCFEFIIMCFIMYWIGKLYHPIVFKIKWFDYLQLKLFAPNITGKYYYMHKQEYKSPKIINKNDIESGKYFHYSDTQLSNKFRRKNINRNNSGDDNDIWFTRMILKPQNLLYKLQNILLKYISTLVLMVIKWCLWYLCCIILVVWTIWILRFNDWHELKVIVITECIIVLCWMSYCSVHTYCQFFIYPQIIKYGEKYYDSDAFEKGI